MHLIETDVMKQFRSGSFEDRIVRARQMVESATAMLGLSGDHVILSTFADHVVVMNEQGQVFRLYDGQHGSPVRLERVDGIKGVSLKEWGTKGRSGARRVVEMMMRGEAVGARLQGLVEAQTEDLGAQVLWEHKVAPLLAGGKWTRFFEQREAPIRTTGWAKGREIRQRRADDWTLESLETALHQDLTEAAMAIDRGNLGSEMKEAMLDMLSNGSQVLEGIKLLRGGRRGAEKASDITHSLLEYRGRIEMMNAYARSLASQRGS